MAASLLMVLLTLPACIILIIRSAHLAGFWPIYIPMAALCTLAIGIAIVAYRRNPGALTRATWAYAFAWTAIIELFYGAYTLLTGRTGGKFFSHRTLRSNAIYPFLLAVTWSVVAFALSRRGRPAKG